MWNERARGVGWIIESFWHWHKYPHFSKIVQYIWLVHKDSGNGDGNDKTKTVIRR